MANEVAIIETRATQLAEKIEILVTEARKKVASVANTAQVYTKSKTVFWKLDVNMENSATSQRKLLEDRNQQYALCLPDKTLLQQKLREWIEEFRKEDEDE